MHGPIHASRSHERSHARTHARTHIPVCVRVVIVLTTNHAQPTPWCAALLQAHMLRHGTTEAEVAAATPHQSYAVEAVGVYGMDGAAFDSTGPVIPLPPPLPTTSFFLVWLT